MVQRFASYSSSLVIWCVAPSTQVLGRSFLACIVGAFVLTHLSFFAYSPFGQGFFAYSPSDVCSNCGRFGTLCLLKAFSPKRGLVFAVNGASPPPRHPGGGFTDNPRGRGSSRSLVHRIAALCVVRCVGHLALPVATSLRCNFWQISCCFVQ